MSEHHLERVIGRFKGETPGPLIIVIAALHGNEPAGVRALELVFDALETARSEHPGFQFQGKLLGLIGNQQAFLIRQRFLEQDLNRVWSGDFLEKIKALSPEDLKAESMEALQLLELMSAECQSAQTQDIVFLDLHTTSAEGGIFSIPTDEGESLELAKHLGAPTILGLQESISGTLLGFASAGGFFQNNHPSPITSHQSTNHQSPIHQSTKHQSPICVAFEAGQHESPQAITRSAIAIVRCLRAMGCIAQNDLVDFAEELSQPFLVAVPPVVRFCYAHHIEAADGFKMRPGYANFQPIQQGEHLADDVRGPVFSPDKGLILMPLYQAKGSDGFFIVQ